MRSESGSSMTKSGVFTSPALCMPSSIHKNAISTLDIFEESGKQHPKQHCNICSCQELTFTHAAAFRIKIQHLL